MLTQIFCNAGTWVKLSDVRNEQTGDQVDNMTGATWSLLDAEGEEIASGDVTKIADTDADYEFTVTREQAADLEEGADYALVVTDGDNLGLRWDVKAVFYRGRAA